MTAWQSVAKPDSALALREMQSDLQRARTTIIVIPANAGTQRLCTKTKVTGFRVHFP